MEEECNGIIELLQCSDTYRETFNNLSDEDKRFYKNRYKTNITMLRSFIVDHIKKEESIPIVDTGMLLVRTPITNCTYYS